MIDEFKPSSWQKDPQDLAKEYNDWDADQTAPDEIPDKPEEFSLSMVRRGNMNPRTGDYNPSSKQRHLTAWVPTGKFLQNYDRIFTQSIAGVAA